jgi:hypothetical protein
MEIFNDYAAGSLVMQEQAQLSLFLSQLLPCLIKQSRRRLVVLLGTKSCLGKQKTPTHITWVKEAF